MDKKEIINNINKNTKRDIKIMSLNETIQRFEEFKKDEDFDKIKNLSLELLLDSDGNINPKKALDLQTKIPIRLVNIDNHMGGASIGIRYKKGNAIEILNVPNKNYD